MRNAVVDVGSNSVLLTVMEDGQTLMETSAVTGLGKSTKESGRLAAEPMAATLLALRNAFEAAHILGARAEAFGTMALRIAGNAAEFLRECESQGTPVSVLSGDDEARLGLLSVALDPQFSGSHPLSIVDVGGHSTEIVTAFPDPSAPDGWRTTFRRSHAIGTLGLRGGTLAKQVLGPQEMLTASSEIDQIFEFAYEPGECGTVVALGATATNLVTIREKMTEWDPVRVHGAAILYEEVSRAAGWLGAMTDAERAAVPGMEKGRETTMHIGALILERALYALRAEQCLATVRGWRHALLLGSSATPP